jgi:hypothetical protein
LATWASAESTSPRRLRSQASLTSRADREMPASVTAEAGNNRRSRRAQNAVRRMRPVPTRSEISSDVIRKPDSVKNVDTPR